MKERGLSELKRVSIEGIRSNSGTSARSKLVSTSTGSSSVAAGRCGSENERGGRYDVMGLLLGIDAGILGYECKSSATQIRRSERQGSLNTDEPSHLLKTSGDESVSCFNSICRKEMG